MANTQVEVIIRLGPEQIQRRIIQTGEHLIGADPSCSLQVGGDGISRKHARLAFEDGKFLIEDLGSSENLKLSRKILQQNQDAKEFSSASLTELHSAMLAQKRTDEAHALMTKLLARDEVIRTKYYTEWRAQLDRGGIGGKLTVDAVGRVELDLNGLPVRDLSPVKGIPLNSIGISRALVSDLSALRGMPLDHVDLVGTQVSDLSPLKGMSLRHLYLTDSVKIEEISSLVGMPLEQLALHGTQVRDLRPLAGMPLKDLQLSGENIKDLRVLEGLQLEGLHLYSVQVSDLSVLARMPLTTLNISGNKGTINTRPLSQLKLDQLRLTEMPLADIGFVRDMPLRHLSLSQTFVRDLSPLKGKDLVVLTLDGTRVIDLSPLSGMPLTQLSFRSTGVNDLRPLSGMKLNDLGVANTKITDLTPLGGILLYNLRLHGCTELQDVRHVAEFKSLQTLSIPIHIKDIEFLRQMPNLKELGYSDNLLPVAEFWKAYDARKK